MQDAWLHLPVIWLNGQAYPLTVNTLGELLEELQTRMQRPQNMPGMAVVRNRRIVPRSQWAVQRLEPQDEIELIGAVQGG